MPTAVVTGASGGIGLELARLLAGDGYDLVLVARRGGKLADLGTELREAHRIAVKVQPADLADPAAPGAIVSRLEQDGATVDVLVNSAGFATLGPFAEAEVAGQLEMLQVNVVALTHLTRLLLPGMVERRRGRILNVASTAAFQPGPLMAVYYASKAYVLSFSEALDHELRGTGVSVTALCPGPTSTGFQERAGQEGARLLKSNPPMPAAEVAAFGYRALMSGDAVAIPGWRNRGGVVATRLLPRSTAARIAKRLHQA